MTPRDFVISIVFVLVASSATVAAIHVAVFGPEKIVPQSTSFALTCALGFSLIRGWVPGRWITVSLLSMASIVSLIGALDASGSMGLWILPAMLGATHLVCLIGLLTPLAARHFSDDHPRAPYRELPSNELNDAIRRKTNEKLLEMLANKENWKPVALEVVRKELKSRGINYSDSQLEPALGNKRGAGQD